MFGAAASLSMTLYCLDWTAEDFMLAMDTLAFWCWATDPTRTDWRNTALLKHLTAEALRAVLATTRVDCNNADMLNLCVCEFLGDETVALQL